MTAEVTSSAPSRKPARRWRLGAAVLVLGALLVLTSSADAVVLSAVTIDGPSEDIVGFGGVAMAEDGTGGAVYLKRVEGVAHVFVARYAQGRWLTPVQVDTAQPFAASWPEIGAANGGELVVVWATPFASVSGHPVEELLSSTMGPGSASFGPARVVDRNIGSGTGTSPALAMSPTGQADVVYRVLDQEEGQLTSIPLLRPEDVVEEVRVAHFEGETWSPPLPVNRNPAVSMRPPTPVNAPQIAIGPTGNGIVVWQEPDEEGVARIWARRLFGRTLDYVMPVSAASLNSKPITADADAPTVTITRSGQAEVAYRQATGPGSPLPGPRVLINTLPDGIAGEGTEFEGAQVVDPELAGGAAAVVGPPDLDSDEKLDVRLLYDANGTPRVFQGNDGKLAASLSLGPPFAGSEPFAATVMNKAGGGISAWPSQDADGRAVVAVREDFPDGAVQTALVSGGDGGPVGELAVGRSGLGDGLVAFRQGPLGDAAIVADQVTAPPVRFAAAAPEGWIKPAGAEVTWQPAESANGPLRYSVVLDGRLLPAAAGALSMRLDRRGLASGRHQIQVLATDDDDQSTLTYPVALRVDGTPPSVRIARARGHVIVVRVADAQSGVSLKTVGVAFGDGTSARGRASFRHRYPRAGIYRVSIRARDKLGNSVTLQRLVSVR